ncbi:Putative fibronectin type III, immunoglobulin-like, fibronectin type III superfamily [Septoria linicola]|uniref:Fibronectin type III, immunoglobulin-like, fibronectin type III superfamily n=1 Tax=Septoria linicola TaxID=215465 RepID=A0A9Q9AR53_9PEZI|nr:putative fibronectin type III, immunoglobulin-like, fibronectin type III superfamily [Septoria linicola]USW53585.1 Putative fibronectin type III, immunoglobulin-like, fibronectin type III superfamily [Septoria linicola]
MAGRPQQAAGYMAVFADTIRENGYLNSNSQFWPYLFAFCQSLAIPMAVYFKPAVVFVAMSWLFLRAYQVLNKPLEDLAGLLGFDIPSAPLIDLAGVKADGAIIHWQLPESPLRMNKTTHKFEVMVNGDVVNSLSVKESAALVTGLQPGCFYVVRVSLVNNMDFASKSQPIRFRTKQLASSDFFSISVDDDGDYDIPQVPIQAVPYRGLKDILPASPEASPMTRENSTGIGPSRSVKGRRPSPSALDLQKHDPPAEETEPPEGAETITRLTERLDAIRRETDEAERLAREEEEEESRQKDELAKERDELRAEALERDKASRNLKKEVNTLERQNTSAQNDRNKHERMLQQKRQERQKLKEDMVRWEQEATSMKDDVERIEKEKSVYLQQAEQDKEALRVKQAEEAASVKLLDDEVREKSAEIKKLERVMKNSSPSLVDHEPNLVQQLQQDAEDKRLWDIQYGNLQHQYTTTLTKLEQAKRMHAEQAAYLEQLRSKRRQEEAAQQYASPPATQERSLRRGDSNRSRRAQSGVSSSESPRMTTFPITSAPFQPSNTTTSSIFSGAPAFFNFQNGMTLPGPTGEMSMSDEDRDRLTGGALMSPGAGAELLPADLFGDGDNKPPDMILPGLGALPGLPGIASSASQNQTTYDPGPASPASGSSRPASVFASPRASAQNLIGSPEGVERIMDSDVRSIRSTRSNRATSGSGAGSRFSGMFGIKQRAKTTSGEEGPALSKSNSMPRQDGGLMGIDSETRKRNSSISGSMLSGPPFGVDAAPPLPAASRRSRALGFFSRPAEQGWPSFTRRPASPRPGSTHSNELPRPSFDSTRWGGDSWAPNDAASGNRSSPLAFGAGWNPNQPQQSRIFGSRHPSRRPSAQYGGSGPPDDITEDEDDDRFDDHRATELGPIGSKPPPGSKKADKEPVDDVKLNPAAKDFKSFLSSMKLTKSKGESSSNAGSASNTPNLAQGENDEDFSPPASRKSRDTRSITTAESSVAESGRNSADLIRIPSYTSEAAPSPLLGGSSVGKESFMQKISRKSSSGGFGIAKFQRNKSKLDTTTPTSVPAEDEEDGAGSLSASISSAKEGKETSGRESKEQGRGSGRNWSNVLKLGSGKDRKEKRGNETPSLSGMSITTDEDRDERERED